ncbi:hypothetical protein [Nocardioides sp. MH1]|uniref:hypothetical protein n=1 Tax=Nocardioides sp. MH1 TaxID=3242490 RepID=UPI00351F9C78
MTSEPAAAPPRSAEDRRHHLDMIQAVIGRMADSGAETKRWTITVAGAAFGVSALNGMWYLSVIGLVVVIALSVVNMNYLHQEHLFIKLFEAAARDGVPLYDMKKDRFTNDVCSRSKTYLSWSVVGFYGAFALAGVAAALIGALVGPANPADDQVPRYHHHDHGFNEGPKAAPPQQHRKPTEPQTLQPPPP